MNFIIDLKIQITITSSSFVQFVGRKMFPSSSSKLQFVTSVWCFEIIEIILRNQSLMMAYNDGL